MIKRVEVTGGPVSTDLCKWFTIGNTEISRSRNIEEGDDDSGKGDGDQAPDAKGSFNRKLLNHYHSIDDSMKLRQIPREGRVIHVTLLLMMKWQNE